MLGKTKRLWGETPTMQSSYDAVIIGGGLHGLATAYFLARNHNINNVAVIEKRYIGFGGAGRNTAIVRANQRTPENVVLYKEGLELWPVLTKELDFNLMFYNCGNLNLAHSEAALKAMRLNVGMPSFTGSIFTWWTARSARNWCRCWIFPIGHVIRSMAGCFIRPAVLCVTMPWCGGWPKGPQKRDSHLPGNGSDRHRNPRRKGQCGQY